MEIQKTIDESLMAVQDSRKGRKRSGKWSPSSLGRCYRYQVWNREDKPVTNPPDSQALRIFKCGDMFHDYIKEFFPTAVKELAMNEEDIFGFADMVDTGEVIEIKSVRSFAFAKIHAKKKLYVVEKDKYEAILQLMTYCVFMKKPVGRLVLVNKDDLSIAEFTFKTKDWEEDVRRELTKLRDYWTRRHTQLPPAEPRAYGGNECRYCSFRDECEGLEKGREF